MTHPDPDPLYIGPEDQGRIEHNVIDHAPGSGWVIVYISALLLGVLGTLLVLYVGGWLR